MIAAPIRYLPQPDTAALIAALTAVRCAGVRAVLVLVGEQVSLDIPAFDAYLQASDIAMFGGVFPRVIYADTYAADAAVVVGLSEAVRVGVVERLSERSVVQAVSECGLAPDECPESIMLWVDAFARQQESLVEAVYDRFGAGPSYLGGGAGSLSFQSRPCLICNRGVIQDAALIVSLHARLGVGADHGWQAVAGPFLVSDARGNEIRTLDYQPAGQVFRAVVEPLAGVNWDECDFFQIAKAFPFGVERMDGSLMVRDPIRMVGSRLVCVGEVPAQTCAYVLRGRPEALVLAAASGSRCAFSELQGATATAAFMVGCISRALFMGDAYADELAAVRAVIRSECPDEISLFGVLSLGEVASARTGGHEFLNKTFALGLLPQRYAGLE